MKKLISLLAVLTMLTQSSLAVLADDETPAEEPKEPVVTETLEENKKNASEAEESDAMEILKTIINEIREEKELPEWVFAEELNKIIEENKAELEILEAEFDVIVFETDNLDQESLKEVFKDDEFIMSDEEQIVGIGIVEEDDLTYTICIINAKETPEQTSKEPETAEIAVEDTESENTETGEALDQTAAVSETLEAEDTASDSVEQYVELQAEENITDSPEINNPVAEEPMQIKTKMMMTAVQSTPVKTTQEQLNDLVKTNTGFVTVNGGQYYIDPSSRKIVKGQRKIGNYWYYFDRSTGEMATGFVNLTAQDESSGAKTVYYDGNGHMLYGFQTINGKKYYLNPGTGALFAGQKSIGGYWYYFKRGTGEMATGFVNLTAQDESSGAKTVYYDGNGHMLYGFVTANGKKYYMSPGTGAMVTGQRSIGGYWYYFKRGTGEMATGFVDLTRQDEPSGAKRVYYDGNGRMCYGFVTVGGKKYYMNPGTGAMVTGQKAIGGYWYYFKRGTGEMATGFVDLTKQDEPSGAKRVYYDKNGHMVHGTVTIDGVKYTFNSVTGAFAGGFIKDSVGTQYIGSSGQPVKGQLKVGNYWYYFDDSTGYMITGWKDIPAQNKRVYYDKNGHMVYGNQTIDGQSYYFNTETGAVMNSFQTIRDSSGRWINVYVSGGEIVKKDFKINNIYYRVDSNTGEILGSTQQFSNSIYLSGVDISEHNGNIDLTQYKNGFVIIRIGYWTTPDKLAVRNMDLCDKYNIPYGVYLYDYTTEPADAVKEAEFTLKMIQGRNIKCGVWFDMEDDGWRARNGVAPNHPNISKICQKYCETIERAGYHVGIYASYSWFENYITGCDRWDKWVAHWGSNNGNWNSDLSNYCQIHQYTSIPLDKNVMYVDPYYFQK